MVKIRKTSRSKPRQAYDYFTKNLEEWKKFKEGEVIEVSNRVFETLAHCSEVVEEEDEETKVKKRRRRN